MAIQLDRFYLDGDVFDVLDECDQLAQGLARLRRQGRLSEHDWITSKQRLSEIRGRIEESLTK
jgi:hypothetical protein